jgi:DNA-binding CsgD family transcriptional regulator
MTTLPNKPILTQREEQVLTLTIQGLTAKQAAQAMGIGARTVESHSAHLFIKHEVGSVAELVALIVRQQERQRFHALLEQCAQTIEALPHPTHPDVLAQAIRAMATAASSEG